MSLAALPIDANNDRLMDEVLGPIFVTSKEVPRMEVMGPIVSWLSSRSPHRDEVILIIMFIVAPVPPPDSHLPSHPFNPGSQILLFR